VSKKAFYIPTRMTPVLLRNNANIGLAKSLIKIMCFEMEVVSLTLAQEVIFGSKKKGMTANGRGILLPSREVNYLARFCK